VAETLTFTGSPSGCGFSSLLVADERDALDLNVWLRGRPPEAVAVSAITYSELWFGIETDDNPARARRRQRWLTKVFRPLEIVPFD
jgi:predicted nucleic acid-binding protein